MNRNERLEIRLSKYEKDRIRMASEKAGITMAEWMRSVLVSASVAAIKEDVSIFSATATISHGFVFVL